MSPPTARRRRLGSDLRKLRELSGLSGRAMATHLGVSQPTIHRIEMGERLPSKSEVADWTTAARASGDDTVRLLEDLDAVYTEIETWRTSIANGDGLEARAAGMESARIVRSFTTSVVPGILQTAEYARRNLELDLYAGDRDIPAVVAERMQRQRLLYEPGRSFTFLMTETALRWPYGPDPVMQAQWDRIRSTVGLQNVTIGIIPLSGPHQSREAHAFGIYEGAEPGEKYVHIELTHGMVTLTDVDDIEVYEALWKRLAGAALFGDRAIEFIQTVSRDQ